VRDGVVIKIVVVVLGVNKMIFKTENIIWSWSRSKSWNERWSWSRSWSIGWSRSNSWSWRGVYKKSCSWGRNHSRSK
jgi:hypothetical protein